MLNIGIALWWVLRPAAEPTASWSPPAGVPRLRLLGEQEGAMTDVARHAEAAPVAPAGVAAAGLRCVAFGPFDSAAAMAGAREALQALGVSRMRVRELAGTPRGWRVFIPPQADRAQADALAARIRQAGFDDLMVMTSDDEANAIALGLYRSESAAGRREASLRAAGFSARTQRWGEAATVHWLDVAAGPGVDADAARRAASATRLQDIDCAGVVEATDAR
jgi:cell division protein FtsN